MKAEELFQAGDVSGALAALQDSIRQSPQDLELRIFLFQLLCIEGNWTRAIQQLKTCATLASKAVPMAQMYREAIICEVYREKVFAGAADPLIFGEPADWIAFLLNAVKQQAAGNTHAATDLRAQAFAAAPTTSGVLNGTAFDWIADADPQLGPILEIIIDGKYFWAPFSTIHRITTEPPTDLRDAIWTPANVTWSNGGNTVALIPTRYAGSTQSDNPAHQLARATDWVTTKDDIPTHCLGQRMLITDAQDVALLDLRDLRLGDAAALVDQTETAQTDG